LGTAPEPGPPTVRGHTVRLHLSDVVGDQRRDADANQAMKGFKITVRLEIAYFRRVSGF
jgi:hypothetical protein